MRCREINFILILLVSFSFAEKPKEKIKRFKNDIKQQIQQRISPDEAYEKTNKELEKLDEKFGLKEEKPEEEIKEELKEEIKKEIKKEIPKPRLIRKNIPQNFTIYNFERIDERNNIQDEELKILQDRIHGLEKQVEQLLIVLHSFQDQNEAQLERNERYDHFFMRWDNLKGTFGDFWKVGGGAILTAAFGLVGGWYWRRRKRLQNGISK